ncbi:MAG TPA: hypothetical protein VH643_35695 [Gemmataceae bacterium]
MRLIAVSLLALAFGVTASGEFAFARPDEKMAKDKKPDDKDKKHKPKFTINKETTYVAGPRDDDGTIDYSVALNLRLRKDVTPDQNAAVLLWKATGPRPEGRPMSAEFYKWLGIDAPPEKGDYFIPQNRYATEQLKIEPGPAFEAYTDEIGRAAQRPWTAKQYPRVADWLKANEKPLAVVLEATKRPQYFSPLVPTRSKKGSSGLIGALLPNVQKCRELAQALTARALLAIADRRLDDAWRDLLACHRLGRLVARGATLIEALVGFAIDTIASNADVALLERAVTDAKVDEKTIRGWLRDLQRLPPMPSMAEKINLGERFMGLDSFMLIARGGLGALEGLSGGSPKEENQMMKYTMDGINWDPALRLANRTYDRMVAAMRVKDRAEREKRLQRLEDDLRNQRKEAVKPENVGKLFLALGIMPDKAGERIGIIAMVLLTPAVRKVQQASDRSEQIQRNLHVAFALACYRREHGRYPDKLDALTPAYLKDVPQDIFSDEALIYRPKGKGYLLYSIGVNERDDGGRGYGDDPPADDLNVRMPLPELRRK